MIDSDRRLVCFLAYFLCIFFVCLDSRTGHVCDSQCLVFFGLFLSLCVVFLSRNQFIRPGKFWLDAACIARSTDTPSSSSFGPFRARASDPRCLFPVCTLFCVGRLGLLVFEGFQTGQSPLIIIMAFLTLCLVPGALGPEVPTFVQLICDMQI